MCASIFSNCPSVERKAGKLLARSSWWAYLTCLSLYSWEVAVDPVRSQVIIVCRFLWFFQTKRVVPFHEIRFVIYDYRGPSGSAVVRWLNEPNEEFFSVGLKLKDQTVIPLFEFQGSKWGSQEEESKNYAGQLSEMVGAPIGR